METESFADDIRTSEAQNEQESGTRPACNADTEEDGSFERLKTLEQTIASLSGQLELCAGLKADLDRDLDKERDKVHQLRDQLENLQRSSDCEKGKLAEDHRKLEVQMKDIKSAKEEVERTLQVANDESKCQIDMHRSRLEENQRTHLERKVQDSAEIKRLSEQIEGLEAEIEAMRGIILSGGEEESQKWESELEGLKASLAAKTSTIANDEEEIKRLNRQIETLSSSADQNILTIKQLRDKVETKQVHADKVTSDAQEKLINLQAQLELLKKSCSDSDKRREEAEKRCGEAEGKMVEVEQQRMELLSGATAAQKQTEAADYHRAAAEVKAAGAARVDVESDKADVHGNNMPVQKSTLSPEAQLLDLERRNLPGPSDLQLTEVINEDSKILIHECYYPAGKVLQIADCLIQTSGSDEWQYCTPDYKKLPSSMYHTSQTLAKAWMGAKHLVRWRTKDKEWFEMWCKRSNYLPQSLRLRKRDYTMVFGGGDTHRIEENQPKRMRDVDLIE
jgi:DNA repair exonuclease SbcCD ATPase subunit